MENLIVGVDCPAAVRLPARGHDSAGEILRTPLMRSIDWLQLALFVGGAGLDHQAHGALPGAGAGCQGPDLARPGPQAGGAPDLSPDGSRSGPGAGLEAVHALPCCSSAWWAAVHLRHSAAAAPAAAQSRRASAR